MANRLISDGEDAPEIVPPLVDEAAYLGDALLAEPGDPESPTSSTFRWVGGR